ncbi:unnamed protein product [Trichogramma brassicae]|uniref:Uncharacterized protein n=1 Tax=Trichogramma brassicae TaxID=86971 RepID=A0A6H5I2K9_9HYME|nr:unnamed protein product [Trichogramma brassicae]
MESVRQNDCNGFDPKPLIRFVMNTGYKDEPKVDQNGTIILRRTTPIHIAYKSACSEVLDDLFQIYDKFDVNYTDDDGNVTHFHAACKYGLYDVVEKFLKLGQDPNCFAEGSNSWPPLFLALIFDKKEVVKLLLKHGSDPNLANGKGETPLHIICQRCENVDDLAMMFFKVNKELNHSPLQIDARDNLGNTPLHLALRTGNKYKLVEWLLERGADPNLANAEGLTPLHIICDGYDDVEGLAEFFFIMNKKIKRTVEIDAKDKSGRTPLQLAVLSLAPKTLDVLLKYGADLSSFPFPSESYFTKDLIPSSSPFFLLFSYINRLSSGSRALIMVDMLENRGYELERGDALKIMGLFTKYRFYYEPMNLDTSWYDDEEFANEAKEMMMKPNLSLYDLVKLRPEEAEKKLTYSDYYDFACSRELMKLPEKLRQACAAHLCETMSRGFFRRWALDSFSELTRLNRLPIECGINFVRLVYTVEEEKRTKNECHSIPRPRHGLHSAQVAVGAARHFLRVRGHDEAHLPHKQGLAQRSEKGIRQVRQSLSAVEHAGLQGAEQVVSQSRRRARSHVRPRHGHRT